MKQTLTDALLVGAVVVLATAAGSCKRQPPAEQRAAEQRPAVSVAPVAVPAAPRALPDEAFRVQWVGTTMPPVMRPGGRAQVHITVKNIGVAEWPNFESTGNRPQGAVRIGYRWLPAKPAPSPEPWARVRGNLPRPLATGQTAELTLEVMAPGTPGPYRIQFDLVQEFIAWFESKGAARLIIPVRVAK